MDINALASADHAHRRPGPPDSDQLAARMASSVANGDISVEELQTRLSDRLGIEDTSAIVGDDGNLDVSALAEVLEINKPTGPREPRGPGGPGGPPPGGRINDLATVLTEALGEETVSSATNEDGSLNMEALLDALQARLDENGSSPVGNVIDTAA